MSLARVIEDSKTLPSEELGRFRVDGVRPKAVVVPESAEEVAGILKMASEEGLAVTPWGGGTMMSLGGIPKKIDLVLLLRNLNRIVEYSPEELVVTAEAGITLGNLQSALAKKNQFLALDPPCASDATLGGIVASNSFGPICHVYGRIRDLMLGIRVANPGGSLTGFGGRVVKNVAGYDMKKLYVGSLGTLGVAVQTTFRLHPIPRFERTLISVFDVLGDFAKASRELLNSSHSSVGIGPSAVEGLDPNSFTILAGDSLSIPQNYVLAVRVAGMTQKAVEERVSELERIVRKHNSIATLPAGNSLHETLWKRIVQYSELSCEKFPIRIKVSTLISKVADVMNATREISEREGLEHSIVAHMGLGIIHIYFSSANPDRVSSATKELRSFVLGIGSASSLVVEAAATDVKQRIDVWGPVRSDFFLMRAVKDRFDPKGILNPGRFVGGI